MSPERREALLDELAAGTTMRRFLEIKAIFDADYAQRHGLAPGDECHEDHIIRTDGTIHWTLENK